MVKSTRFADRMQDLSAKVAGETLKLTRQPEIISFAVGMPARDAFPREHSADLAELVIREWKGAVPQSGVTEGFYS